jgi:hypothetical protein
MFVDILNARRRKLLKEEGRFSPLLLNSFVLSSRELQASKRLGAPSFMRVDEKRWCQASD